MPLLDGAAPPAAQWRRVLAEDYAHPHYHVSFITALGRRIRRNYLWIVAIQGSAYVGKLLVHPQPLTTVAEFFDRADVGPMPGEVVLGIGAVYLLALAGIGAWSAAADLRKWGPKSAGGMG